MNLSSSINNYNIWYIIIKNKGHKFEELWDTWEDLEGGEGEGKGYKHMQASTHFMKSKMMFYSQNTQFSN